MSRRRRRVFLSGPPGVGKSTLSRELGRALGGSSADLDDLITTDCGRTPAEIIRAEGEARFREIEAETLEALTDTFEVVALGGGTLTTRRGLAAARSRGILVGLDVDVETLRKRVFTSGVDRPLLDPTADGDPLRALLDRRRSAYATVDRTVDATGDISVVTDRLVDVVQSTNMIDAQVGHSRSRVLVGRALAHAAQGAVESHAPLRPTLVLVDDGVPAKQSAAYVSQIQQDREVHVLHVPGGETVKTWAFLGDVLEKAVDAGCGRQSVVIGIGGGATCDLTGMVAGLLGRGAPLILVPTTVVAQADASVGGKCAINIPSGRNLVGVFHPATDVIIDIDFLSSLAPDEYRSGLAEVLKMGIICDETLFTELAHSPQLTLQQLTRAVDYKAEIVFGDPFEQGWRKVLNLGHSLGHVLESASGFTMRHGDAVAIGIAAIARLSSQRGWLKPAVRDVILSGLAATGLPVSAPVDLLEDVETYLKRDKKSTSRNIDLIAIRKLGSVSIETVDLEDTARKLARAGGT